MEWMWNGVEWLWQVCGMIAEWLWNGCCIVVEWLCKHGCCGIVVVEWLLLNMVVRKLVGVELLLLLNGCSRMVV